MAQHVKSECIRCGKQYDHEAMTWAYLISDGEAAHGYDGDRWYWTDNQGNTFRPSVTEYRCETEKVYAPGGPYDYCPKCFSEHLDRVERINRDYPDSPCAPSWFDPADAGECWDSDY